MEIKNRGMSIWTSGDHRRTQNTEYASESLIRIKAELDAAAKEPDEAIQPRIQQIQ